MDPVSLPASRVIATAGRSEEAPPCLVADHLKHRGPNMKAMMVRTGTLALVMTFFACIAGAQSLGEIARKQRAERAKEHEKPVKVYTNDDIPHAPSIESSSNEGASESSSGQAAQQPRSVNPAINLAEKTAQTAGGEAAATNKAEEHAAGEAPESKMKTRDYWQARFKQAREALGLAKEHQQLDENELDLLQLQRTRELDPNKAAGLDKRIAAKKGDLAARQADTAKAQKVLDDLEKEFKASGAPAGWSKTD
jgi:hypothetical protein